MQGPTPVSLLPDFDGNKSCILSGYIISVRTTKMNLRCPDLTLLQRASFEKTAWKERKWSGPHGASPLHGSPEPALPDPSVTPRRPCRVSSRTSCLQTLAESGGPVGTRTSGPLGTQAAGGRRALPALRAQGKGGTSSPAGSWHPLGPGVTQAEPGPGGAPGCRPRGLRRAPLSVPCQLTAGRREQALSGWAEENCWGQKVSMPRRGQARRSHQQAATRPNSRFLRVTYS